MELSFISRIREMQKEKGVNISYKCTICKDTGMELTERNTYKRCVCVEREMIEKQWEELGINPNDPKTFETFEERNEEVKRAKYTAISFVGQVKERVDGRHNSLLLIGQSGAGKSHLCKAVFHELIKDNIFITPMIFRDSIDKLKMKFSDIEAEKLMEKFKNAKMLYIDDLFKGGYTDSDIKTMFELIDYRYRKYLPTIVSTELMIKDLIEADEALGTRILEMSKGHIAMVPKSLSNNYRLKKD